MLKGINKQIIEIKCTDNEHFEKALLFVRRGSSTLPYDELLGSAEQFTEQLSGDSRRRVSRLWVGAACALAVASAAAALMLFLL